MTTLHQFCIYDRPADYPAFFVVREWFVVEGQSEPCPGDVRLAPTLDEARALVPPGMVPIERSPGDDPCIVETWI